MLIATQGVSSLRDSDPFGGSYPALRFAPCWAKGGSARPAGLGLIAVTADTEEELGFPPRAKADPSSG